MLFRKLTLNAILAVGILGFTIGCADNKPAENDVKKTADKKEEEKGKQTHSHPHPHNHDVPLTSAEIDKLKADTAKYADAIEHIEKYLATIKTETTGGEPEKAHRSLDNLDVVLKRLGEAAAGSGVPKEQLQMVSEAAQNLQDAFNKIHANIDDGKASDYESQAEAIDTNLKTLKEIKPAG